LPDFDGIEQVPCRFHGGAAKRALHGQHLIARKGEEAI
jgi:hypothetical protein